MTEPQVSLRVEGERFSPLQGLTNTINITIDTKCDEILENPTNGSRTFSGETLRISPPVVVNFNLNSTNHYDIRQILRTKLNTSYSMYESLASEISTSATNLGFGFNGFIMNIFVTITYYHHTVVFVMFDPPSDPTPSDSNDDCEELSLKTAISRMVLRGRINSEELESLNIQKESCSICLNDLSSSNSKHGDPTRMSCSHIFHDGCLLEWLDRKNTCPLCRTVLYHR